MCIQPWWPIWPAWLTITCGAARICCLSGLRQQGEGLFYCWDLNFLRKNIFSSSCKVKYCHIQVYYCHYQLYTTSSLTLLVILADCCPHHASEESRDMWKFGAQFKGRHPHLTRQKCGMSRKLICCRSCTWAKRVGCVTQWLTPRWIGSGHGHFKKDFHCMAVREEPILAGNL